MLNLRKKILFTIVFISILLLLLIIVCEIFFRFKLENEINSYGFGPGTVKFEKLNVNLIDGYRDYFHKIEKKNKIRILAIGDSYHFGAGIKNYRDIYFFKIEDYLNKNFDNRFEFINISKGGWNLDKYYNKILSDGLKFKPDFILLGFVFNDIEIDNRFVNSKHIKLCFFSDRIEWFLRNNSYFFYYVETRLNNFLNDHIYKQNYTDFLVQQYNNDNKEFKKLIEYYKKISKICD